MERGLDSFAVGYTHNTDGANALAWPPGGQGGRRRTGGRSARQHSGAASCGSRIPPNTPAGLCAGVRGCSAPERKCPPPPARCFGLSCGPAACLVVALLLPPLSPLPADALSYGAAEAAQGGTRTAHHAPQPTESVGGAYRTAPTISDAYGGGDLGGGDAYALFRMAAARPPRWVGGEGKHFRVRLEGWGAGLDDAPPAAGPHNRTRPDADTVGSGSAVRPSPDGGGVSCQPVNNLLITCEYPVNNLDPHAETSLSTLCTFTRTVKRTEISYSERSYDSKPSPVDFVNLCEVVPTRTLFQLPNGRLSRLPVGIVSTSARLSA